MNLSALVVALLVSFGAISSAYADERDDATEEATTIVKLLGAKKYREVWEQHAGTIFMKYGTEESFVAYHTMGRVQLAEQTHTQVVAVDASNYDPGTQFSGKIYAVTFLNQYGSTKLYERVVVFLDGSSFKLGGYFVAPVPTQ
ncbi:DUF4019 domain-containing protein [Mesorhizobium sp. M00.F.Ca.ET.186.01.1.1]|nr:DUF4019 domain-containing protein [bacterium M00.F.Ca.ET.205.01.1.1]TGU54524.1 DUF4019 domain-containing protein [bacterium M00.F.Ca.ET.152.01.1.1]TGV38691.1 DUF4019 domain-containing protein [Mesorhizobium sp. M00.F.Ca.ET.186.01.1.1]TGZ44096.1 DUF4019 domain-containing protein [bacterium M00.F.Ca.ET.162.01.1.1]